MLIRTGDTLAGDLQKAISTSVSPKTYLSVAIKNEMGVHGKHNALSSSGFLNSLCRCGLPFGPAVDMIKRRYAGLSGQSGQTVPN